jgi:hypothetical protein
MPFSRGFSVKKKAILSVAAGVVSLALSVGLYAVHSAPNGEPGIVSRPAGQSEIQPPPNPQQLKPVERVVVTSK